jgi:hypothetical protein
VRTGPTGVILSTLNEGRETAKVVAKDLNEGTLFVCSSPLQTNSYFALGHHFKTHVSLRGVSPKNVNLGLDALFFEQPKRSDQNRVLILRSPFFHRKHS